jgi:hypothetical protein
VSDAPAGLFNSFAVGVDYTSPGDETAAPKTAASSSGRFDPGEHTVAEVEEYLAKYPDQRDRVLAAEQAGSARTTLVGE